MPGSKLIRKRITTIYKRVCKVSAIPPNTKRGKAKNPRWMNPNSQRIMKITRTALIISTILLQVFIENANCSNMK